ncbi:phospholipid-translocating p-type flippase family protein, putative [Ichthyophthirius multifiliis]|uniref:Phospholipid-translocating p-type flippase family protein, putative n=1 Tax=Ichthyophthirius multifiliis TaxID=5932 RepID=G0QSA8_ICHMU|nr:phospholipid-translocating p-type flippase family protein, putative [Ichthyophthirius multifiliis]EGR31906.1 phospholipid-translocating p-type flippase family protein, putative [Ichthyophthirius multifiliis]|eukprot:XP_004035392.1 phospholipid-translocating p-type flippase family protein, putative [Ichthyophthirius multifiliis]
MNIPSNLQFYITFFQLLPEGIILLGPSSQKLHIINKQAENLIGLKGSLAIEKLLLLKNNMTKLNEQETIGVNNNMPLALKMKNIIQQQDLNFNKKKEEISPQMQIQLNKQYQQTNPYNQNAFQIRKKYTSDQNNDVSQNLEYQKKYFEVTCVPSVIEKKACVLFLIRDVTHFNQIKLLKLINKNKSQMLSQVSHEFRTPLNCIISMIEMVCMQLNEKIDLLQYLKPALTSAKQLNFMVNDILDIAQVNVGKFSLNIEQFNLKELIFQLLDLLKIQADQKNILLKVIYDSILPVIIASDPNRLRQIITNLISNALKFTKKGGQISIKIKLYEENQFLVSIKDTGIGISQEDQKLLFKKFGKINGKNQNKLNPMGVGLGLIISNTLAQKLGNGEGLQIKSVLGKGTKFFFILLNQSDQLRSSRNSITLQNNYYQNNNNNVYNLFRILIVDDIFLNITVLKMKIEKLIQNVEIQSVCDAEEALFLIKSLFTNNSYNRQNIYDIIFLDLCMPIVDGYCLFQQIKDFISQKDISLKLKVVACSGYSDNEERVKCLDLGMVDYIVKPIEQVKLKQVLQDQLNIFL